MTPGPGRPTVSVVIPVLDDAPALEGCLAALAAQTRAPDEVIVVDNSPGAADEATAALARGAGARVVRETRRGVGAASAAGYDEARGTVIARLDADSRPAPDWVETALRELADPLVHAVTGPGTFYDIPGLRGLLAALAYHLPLRAVGWSMGHPPLWGSNMAIRTCAWRAASEVVRRDDPLVHDDLDLAFALGPLARVRWTPALRVSVEGRAFGSRAAMAARVRRTFHTCRLHWARQGPGERLLCSLTRGRIFHDPTVSTVE